jgi:hypothetical protein
MKFDIQKKLHQVRFLFNHLKMQKFDPAQPGVGLIVLAVGILLFSAMLYKYNRLTVTSQDEYASVTLPRSQFINQIDYKNTLVPKLLPELSVQYVTLLVTDKKQTQLVYAYALPTGQVSAPDNLVALAEQLKIHLLNQPDLKNVQVEVLDQNKKQIRFSATNATAKMHYQESCLLTAGQSTLLSTCVRTQGEAGMEQAQKLLSSIKIKRGFK